MLRNALALSTLTGKPFVIRDIRAKRPEPGLKQQHLMAVRALGSVTGARYKGASVGSTEVEFCPGSIKPGKYEIDIGTAGSITLLLQAFLLPIVVSRQTLSLRISGGTDVEWSQPWDHFCQVLLPHIRRQCNLEARLIRRGYYPKGGGLVELTFSPKQMIEPIRLERQASLEYVSGISNASTSLAERRVAERQGEAAKQALDAPVSIETSYSDSLSPGSGITLIAHFSENQVLGASALGARSKTAEAVGREAAMQLKEALGLAFHLFKRPFASFDVTKLWCIVTMNVQVPFTQELYAHPEQPD